jgi:osmotically-inducible protein OsmY
MAAGARKDVVWDAGAGRDPRREALDIEAAIADALARNARLRHHRVVVSAGPDGLVTLTGAVSTQSRAGRSS